MFRSQSAYDSARRWAIETIPSQSENPAKLILRWAGSFLIDFPSFPRSQDFNQSVDVFQSSILFYQVFRVPYKASFSTIRGSAVACWPRVARPLMTAEILPSTVWGRFGQYGRRVSILMK